MNRADPTAEQDLKRLRELDREIAKVELELQALKDARLKIAMRRRERRLGVTR